MKRIFSLLLSLLLVFTVFGVNTYAASDSSLSDIHIRTVEEWNALAEKCALNTYSNKLTVYIDNDISFEGRDFYPLPYFNGTLDGQNHILSDITYEPTSINNGVIRLTCPDSIIRNLNVTYTITSSADRVGFIGYNEGTVSNVNVNGSLDGNGIVGLVVGFNAVGGKVIDCSTDGSIVGKNYTGGIVGTNYGRIQGCKNRAHVNITTDDDTIDIQSITIETIQKSENAATVTDTGGVVGANYGVVSTCTNYSTVGYDHVGYNVGGIAGSSTGYMENCTNLGEVYGRKEVGGIVGQEEPCLIIKYAQSYLEILKKDLNNIKDVCDELNNNVNEFSDTTVTCMNGMSTNLNQATKSVDTMLKELKNTKISGDIDIDSDATLQPEFSTAFEDARTSLNSSMTEFTNYWTFMNSKNSDTSGDIVDGLDELNDLVNDFGNTAIEGIDYYTSDRDLYKDISDKDTDKEVDGKIKSCYNYNYVEADLNAGGIVGAMAIENNLDPEDDFDISGTATENFTYEMRAVVDKCVNEGRVTATKNYAGGIVGNEELGLIKNSINYGLVDSEEADYVGGIVGMSVASIKNNYAKCFIWGDDYVGGIAGSATKAEGNGSLAQIEAAETNVGSIFGNYGLIEENPVDESEDIKKNWYVYDDYAAIDGISYAGMAYGISTEEMLELDIDENLKKVNVFFVNDGVNIKKYTLNYGESLDISSVPNNIDEGDDYGYWDGYADVKLTNITRDLLFTNEYESVRPSISTEEDIAYVVAEGRFSKDDKVKLSEIEENGPLTNYEGLAYEIEFAIADTSYVNRLRLYGLGYDNYDVYVRQDGRWNKVDYEVDGSYAVIDYLAEYDGYAIVKVNDYTPYIAAAAGIAVVLLAISIIFKKIKEKKKNSPKEASANETPVEEINTEASENITTEEKAEESKKSCCLKKMFSDRKKKKGKK